MKFNSLKTSWVLKPRYWRTWFYISIFYLITFLPKSLQFKLGKKLGKLLQKRKRLKRIVNTNISICFPDYDATQIENLSSSYFINQGIDMVESLNIWGRNGFNWIEGRLEVNGIENLERSLAKGKPVIFVGSHFSNVDMGAMLLAYVGKKYGLFDFAVTYREQENPILSWIMKRGRDQYFRHVVPATDIRSVVKELKNKRHVWFAPDMDVDKKNAIFVPFMGIQASTTTSISRLAKMTGAIVIPYANYRDENSFNYRIEIHSELESFPSADIENDTTRINQFIERLVREKPESYLWILRRFKTRPPGEKSFY